MVNFHTRGLIAPKWALTHRFFPIILLLWGLQNMGHDTFFPTISLFCSSPDLLHSKALYWYHARRMMKWHTDALFSYPRLAYPWIYRFIEANTQFDRGLHDNSHWLPLHTTITMWRDFLMTHTQTTTLIGLHHSYGGLPHLQGHSRWLTLGNKLTIPLRFSLYLLFLLVETCVPFLAIMLHPLGILSILYYF